MNGLGAGQGGAGGGGGGGGAAATAAAGYPTPAGYTAELGYISTMVEQLSQQLADNKRVLDDVVSGVGRVRNRARAQQLGNEELIGGASEELQAQDGNLDAKVSALDEALSAARYGKDANAELLAQYAAAMAGMLKQFHEYKQKHVADVAAWHRSYRHQLAEARAENSRLRDQIWQMQERAGRANASLRAFRAAYDADPVRWDGRVALRALRQEVRFWKRKARPDLPDDDPAWSDDDDLVDPVEKARLHELDRKYAEDQREILQQQQAAAQLEQQQQIQQQQQQIQQMQQRHEQEMQELQQQQQQQQMNLQKYSFQQWSESSSTDDTTQHSAAPNPSEPSASSGSSDRPDQPGPDARDEDDAGQPPPAVPPPPASAPRPAFFGRMGGDGAHDLDDSVDADSNGDASITIHAEGLHDSTTAADLPPRPPSAASNGSNGSTDSTGSDDTDSSDSSSGSMGSTGSEGSTGSAGGV